MWGSCAAIAGTGFDDLRSFGHRSRTLQMGYDRADYAGKPVIAVVNTWSEINPCHTHLRDRAQDVKRGVWQAGGFPLEVPALSLSEPFMKPSTMLYRNLLAMETEELLRSYPFDGAVLLGGCDKTTPALVMGALSAGLAVHLRAGRADAARVAGGARPWARARTSGSTGTSCGPGGSPRPTGRRSRSGSPASPGHCMTMGTASTMTSAVEALGLDAAGRGVDPGRRLRPPAHGGRRGPSHRLAARVAALRRVLRERDQGRAGAGRLDQRGHPPDRHGGPGRASSCRCRASTSSPAPCRCWPTSARRAST